MLLTGDIGTAEVDRLLLELERNLESAKLTFKGMLLHRSTVCRRTNGWPELESLLSQVKVYGRSIDTAGPIFSNKVLRHTFTMLGLFADGNRA